MENYLTYEQALSVIRVFAQSQGFYGRLLRQLEELSEEQIADFEQDLIDNKVQNDMDLIFYFES